MALKLQNYDIEIAYRPGKLNGNADGLSRQNFDEDDNYDRGLPVHDVYQPGKDGAPGLAGGPVGPGKRKKKREKKEKKEE